MLHLQLKGGARIGVGGGGVLGIYLSMWAASMVVANISKLIIGKILL